MSTINLESELIRSRTGLNRRAQQRLFIGALVVCDALALILAFLVARFIRFELEIPFFDETGIPSTYQLWGSLLAIPLCLIVFKLFQLYDPQYLLGGTQEYSRVFNATTVTVTVAIVATFVFPDFRISRGWITLDWLLGITAVLFMRFFIRRVVYRLRRQGIMTRRTLIVGADAEARAIAEQLRATPTCGAELLGLVANDQPPGTVVNGLVVLGSLERLPALVGQYDVEEVIISTEGLHRSEMLNIFQNFAYVEGVDVRFSSGLFEIFAAGVHIREIGSVPLVSMNKVRLDPWETAIKTTLDYLASLALLILLTPLFIVVAIMIKRDSPGPVIHRRRVIGRGGRTFDAFKFRTMYTNGAEILAQNPELQAELRANHKLKHDPRVTRIGERLRRTSLDELPQLVNVLLGQMSLVGPRMITLEETEMYGRWRLNLLTVKPGITGWWQISGRSDVSYDQRVRLDMYYIRNYSIWLDFQILWRTIPVVFRRKGAY